MMEFEYFKLNRNRQIVKRMTIDLDDYVAIVANGWDWKIFRKKGRPLVMNSYETFDIYAKNQLSNDESVASYGYTHIYDGNGYSPKNKLRDEKGRPLKKYTQPEDILGRAIKLNYHDQVSDELWKYIKDRKMFFYDEEPWREILKDREAVVKFEHPIEPQKTVEEPTYLGGDQEKEDQFFEERGNMYVGEKTPLWIIIGAILLIPFNLPLWWKYMFKK